MPTLFELFGIRFYFYSEEHLPIHVHIQNGDGRAKVNVYPEIEVVSSNGIKPLYVFITIEQPKLIRNIRV